MSSQDTALKRSLTLPMCVSLVVGAIIGAGIFTTTGAGIKLVGTAVPFVFLLATVFVMVTNLPSIYQAGAIPATGGSYMYVSRFVHPIAGYVHIVSSTIGILNIAVMGISFATYLGRLFPASGAQTIMYVGSIGVILALAVAQNFGAKMSGYVQYIITGLMMVALLVFIVPGMLAVSPEYVTFQKAFWPATVELSAVWSGLALLRYALQGGGVVFTLGDEVKNPRFTIPAAFFIGTLLVGIIYALIGWIDVGVLPLDQVAGQPLTVAAEKVLGTGGWFSFFIVGGALLAIVTTLNGSFMIYSRTHFAAARDHIWPEVLMKTNKHKAPHVAIWLCAAIGIIAVLFFKDNLNDLLMFVSVPGLIMAFIYYIPPMMIQRRLPNCANRAWFKMPYWLLCAICIVSSVLTFYLGISLFSRLQPIHWIGMASVYVLGFVYYFFRHRWLKQNKGIDIIAASKGMHPYWLEVESGLEEKAEGGIGA